MKKNKMLHDEPRVNKLTDPPDTFSEQPLCIGCRFSGLVHNQITCNRFGHTMDRYHYRYFACDGFVSRADPEKTFTPPNFSRVGVQRRCTNCKYLVIGHNFFGVSDCYECGLHKNAVPDAYHICSDYR